jgi:hypothetical protein
MKLADSDLAIINQQLKDKYGLDTVSGLPIFRNSWAEDQFENKFGTYEDRTESGIYLRTVTEVRKVRKYPFDDGKYILERLVVIPETDKGELVGAQLSYEPLWTWEDRKGNPLPPKINACEFLIQNVLAAQAVAKMMITGDMQKDRPTMARYTDPENSQEASIELKRKRLIEIENELYGDEAGQIGLDLAIGQAVTVPSNYEKVK